VLGVLFFLLFCCVLPVVLYRISGGEPALWLHFNASHSNANTRLLYVPAEQRTKMQGDLDMFKKGMDDAIQSHDSTFRGYIDMRADHGKFKRGLVAEGKYTKRAPSYPAVDGEVEPSPPTSCTKAPAAASAQSAPTQPAAPVPAQPSIDSDLDAEFVEPAKDRERRLEWIRFYVRENNLQKAFDLGWDGKPFRMTSAASSMVISGSQPTAESAPIPPLRETEGAATSGAERAGDQQTTAAAAAAAEAEGTSALHRI